MVDFIDKSSYKNGQNLKKKIWHQNLMTIIRIINCRQKLLMTFINRSITNKNICQPYISLKSVDKFDFTNKLILVDKILLMIIKKI